MNKIEKRQKAGTFSYIHPAVLPSNILVHKNKNCIVEALRHILTYLEVLRKNKIMKGIAPPTFGVGLSLLTVKL